MAKPPLSPAERYLAHLYDIFGVEPEMYPMDDPEDGQPSVTALVYRDVPEPGFITGITYGLSLGSNPEWKHGRPELCITMESGEEGWAMVAAYVANGLRQACPFTYGSTIRFHQKIQEESEMNAFLIFAPSILQKDQYANINIGASYPIHIAGLYPIHEIEIDTIQRIGLKDFWHHPGFDPFYVRRMPIV